MKFSTSASISVVIPAYNRAATIQSCLESVVQQTLTPLEIIVVDDCSKDNTADIVAGFSGENVRCVKMEKNAGAQAARNRGILEARGDWIAFQDSDDVWLPAKLEKQFGALSKVGFDVNTVVHCNAILLDTGTGRRVHDNLPLIEGQDVYRQLLTKPGPMFPGMLASRKALERINYLDENVPSCQEWDTAIRLAQHCRFLHLREALFIYRVNRQDSISHDARRGIKGYHYVIDKHCEDILRVGGEELWHKHLLTLIRMALDSRLWDTADFYLAQIQKYSLKAIVLSCCRRLHLRPANLLALYEPLVQRMKHEEGF